MKPISRFCQKALLGLALVATSQASASPCDDSGVFNDVFMQASACQNRVSSLQFRLGQIQSDLQQLMPQASQVDELIRRADGCQSELGRMGGEFNQRNAEASALQNETQSLQAQSAAASQEIAYWKAPLPRFKCTTRARKRPDLSWETVARTRTEAIANNMRQCAGICADSAFEHNCTAVAQ